MPDPTNLVALKATKDGVELLDKLGVLERLSLKLVSNPDKASAKLAVALGELSLGYTTLHNEILALGTLSFDAEVLQETRKRLTKLKDGRLRVELASVKGHCSRIGSIYTRYLTGWFSETLTKAEAKQLEKLFRELEHMDGLFIKGADALSDLAQQHAKELLSMLRSKRFADAEAAVEMLETKLAPMREKLSNNMARLWQLQAQFISASRAI